MKEKLAFYIKRIKEGRLKEMLAQTKWIYGYARRHWLAMILYTALGMVSTVVALLSSLVSRDLVDIITGHQTGAVIATFASMIGLGMGSTVLNMLSSFATSWINMKVNNDIQADIFEKILVTDWESLTNYHTGDLLTRWGSDVGQVSNGVLNFIPDAIVFLFRFLSAFAMVAFYDPTFLIFAFLGMPVSLLLSKTLMRRMVNNNKRSAALGAKMSGFNQETFANIQIIKGFDLIRQYTKRLRALQKEYVKMVMDFKKMSIWTSLLMSFVGMLVSYAAYGWGIYRVWSGAITFGSMTMFLGLSGQLTGALHNLTSLVPTAIGLTTSAGRLMDIVEMPREDYSAEPIAAEFLANHREEGIGLELNGLSYSYQTGTEVFRGACMEAHPHEIIGLVGPSGEGKTTMMRLLLSLAVPKDGEAIFRAGEDSILLSPATRRFIAYVPQGNTMMSGTIAENMRNVKQDATDEEIVEALKLACAWDFVSKLPDGINSAVKERGGGFSEGQAQRLSIARALLRKSPVLLLDEATSALDVATERQVLRSIMSDDYPRTCIVTTHRPTVLTMCNRVYAIRDKQCTVLNQDEVDAMIRDF